MAGIDLKRFAGRVAVVTGGSRGIGRGIALALGEIGYKVVVNYAQRREAAEEVLRALEGMGTEGLALQADIGQRTDRDAFVDRILEAYGRIDLLVNNAGVAPSVRADLLEATEESFDRVLAINLKGPYFLTQRVAREMIGLKQREPEAEPMIVNIGSISAYTASVNRGEYCVSKAGIAMMTKLYADRLAEYGIRVYEIRPGIIATDMTAAVKQKYDDLFAAGVTPIREWGHPEDVGKAVAAIALGLLPYSTGEVINVDGGFHLRRL